MSSKFGRIRPRTTELAALEHRKNSHRLIMGKTTSSHYFSRLFLIGSFSYLQVMRTCIKAWMSLNLGQIPPLTMALAALERLKIDVTTFSPLLLIRSFSNLQVIRTCIISWMSSNFGQIWPPTTELAALSVGKNSHRFIMGKTKSSRFLGCFWSDTFHTCR